MALKTAPGLVLSAVLMAPLAAGEDAAARIGELQKDFGPPALWVPAPDSPPRVDGKLDDAAWRQATPVKLRFLNGRFETPTQPTEARVLADARKIYFGVRCLESHPEQMISAGKKHDGALWAGDTVEFFLDPGHHEQRGRYYHIIVNPKGLTYDARDRDKNAWNPKLEVRTAVFADGWCVELAVPFSELGLKSGATPKVWGLNINRQRPELGEIAPVKKIVLGPQPKLEHPERYREGEDTAWAPAYCGSSHIVQCFGHVELEAGTVAVQAPKRIFEVVYRSDFENGQTGPWKNAEIVNGSFRGKGQCLAPKGGVGAVHFRFPLKDVDDMTMILALRMPQNGRLYYYGRAPDGMQCEADRHEIFLTAEQAGLRSFVGLDVYHTHGGKMAWKCDGRLRKGPGPWKMMSGHFSEPSIGSVLQPGTDWCILRTRLGQFRRQHEQSLAPLAQGYPNGLTFHAGKTPFLIDEVIFFRGRDAEGPEAVTGLQIARIAGKARLAWHKARDNTFTSYYEIYLDGKKIAETHRLSCLLPLPPGAGGNLTVVAKDLYGNASRPSKPLRVAAAESVRAAKEKTKGVGPLK